MASRILTGPLIFSNFKHFNKNNVLQTLCIRSNTFHCKSRHLSRTPAMSANHLTTSIKDDIGVIVFDSPGKVNSLNEEVMDEFNSIFNSFQTDTRVQAIVIRSSKPDCFIAGADINMLKACETAEEMEGISREGQKLLLKIENSPKPVVAAIMGSCFGGGLEVALASHYRIAAATRKTQLGTPEVQLGLLPGAGGSQRLPALVPLDQALDLMLTGKNVDAQKAKRLGLIDQVVASLGPGVCNPDEGTLLYLEKVAIETARNLASGKLKRSIRKKGIVENVMNYMLKFQRGRDYFFQKVMDKVMKATKGVYPAPLKIIEVVRKSIEQGKEVGYNLEAEAFGQLGSTNESKGLIGLFDGMTACKKNRFGVPQVPVRKVAVLGAGLMGAGIAQVSIDKHLKTILKDVSVEGLARGQQQIEKGLQDAVKKKKLTQSESDKVSSNLLATLTYEGFKDVDVVIEAVFEDIRIKHAVIKEIEQHVPDHCIVATNTSALSVTQIAEASKRPEKVIGMHYFSPVDKMLLLELVTCDKTSNDTIASAVDVGLRQGKVVITVKDSPGFYTTRCLSALAAEAFELLLEGLDPKDLDKKTMLVGFPIGSATLMDEVGVDVAAHINKYLSVALGDKLCIKPEDGVIFEEMVAKGYLGRKSGKGIFVYEGSSKDREVNPGFKEILNAHLKQPKIPLTYEDVRMRVLGRFTNQCIMCLQEGVLANPLEGDVGAVFGLGFPPFLGGPFRFVDIYGADNLVGQLKRFEDIYGARFQPCQLLLDYAKGSKKFHSKGIPLASKKVMAV